MGLSLLKRVHSFILYGTFPEQRFYVRNLLSQDDHIVLPVRLLGGRASGSGVHRCTLGLKPKIENCKLQCQVPASGLTQPLLRPSVISECTSQAVN